MKAYEITQAPYSQPDTPLPQIMGTLLQDAANLACEDVRFDLVIEGGRRLRWFVAIRCRLADPQRRNTVEAALARSMEERFRHFGHTLETAEETEWDAAVTGPREIVRALVREHSPYCANLSPMTYIRRSTLHRADVQNVLPLLLDSRAQLIVQFCPTLLTAAERETAEERAIAYMNAAQMLANHDQTAADAACAWADVVAAENAPFALAGLFVRGTREETAGIAARLQSTYRQLSGGNVSFRNLNLPGAYPDLWDCVPELCRTSEGRLPALCTDEELDVLCPVPVVEDTFSPLPGNVTSLMERHLLPPAFTSGGGIHLGRSADGPFSLPLHTLAKSLFGCGETGTGKSTLAQTVVQQLTEQGVHVLAITPAKDLRLTALRAGMQILRMGEAGFRLTPFQIPQAVPLRDYKPLLNQFFGGCIAMGSDGSPLPALFMESISRVYARYNYTASTRGGTGERFGFTEFMEIFHSNVDDSLYESDLVGNLKTAASVRISRLLEASPTFGSIHGLSPEELLEGSGSLIEIDDEFTGRAAASLILIQLVAFLKANPAPDSSRPLRAIVLLDEAHRLLDAGERHFSTQEDQNAAALTQKLFLNAVTELRKQGIGTIFLDQSILRMPQSLVDACGTKLMFRLTGSEAEAASQKLGVPACVFSHMQTGQAVAASCGLPPTLLETMDRPNGTLSDREVETYMASRLQKPTPPPFKACSACTRCKQAGCFDPVRETAEMLAQKIHIHRRKDGPLTEVSLQSLCLAIPKILRRHGFSDGRLPACVAVHLTGRVTRLTGLVPRYGAEQLIRNIDEMVEEEGGWI